MGRRSMKGGVALEFLVSLPMFGLFFSSMIILGTSLRVLGAANQSAFNVALYAAGYDPGGAAVTDPGALGLTLFRASVPSMMLGDRQEFSTVYLDSDDNGETDVVSVSYSGDVRSLGILGFMQQTPLGITVSLPLIASYNASNSVSPNFQNASQFYCGDGTAAPGNNPAACPAFPDGSEGCAKLEEYCKVVQEVGTPDEELAK